MGGGDWGGGGGDGGVGGGGVGGGGGGGGSTGTKVAPPGGFSRTIFFNNFIFVPYAIVRVP